MLHAGYQTAQRIFGGMYTPHESILGIIQRTLLPTSRAFSDADKKLDPADKQRDVA